MSGQFQHDMPYGAQLLGDGRVRFRLWAPDAAQVGIEIDDADAGAMQRLADGWFERVMVVPAGTHYRYRINGALAVPDPASRLQHVGDVHGASVVVDPGRYVWGEASWLGRPWTEVVVMEVHVGAMGGFAGVRAALPRWRDLGITAIELMPLAQFPGAHNWGYDGVLPYAPAAAYGSPDELKALVDAAHALGLMMFLDEVYNHFGPDGNYLGEYASAFFQAPDDAQPDSAPATPWGAAIQVRVPTVGDFFVHNALYWVNEYRFDGLRFDAVHAINNNDWLIRLATRVRAGIDPARHVHLILENENNQASLLTPDRFDAQWNDDFHNSVHVLLTGETDGYYGAYAQDPVGKLVRCLAEGFAWQGEPLRGKPRGEPSAQLPPIHFVNFLQNHDQVGNRAFGERLDALVSTQVLEAAYAVLLLAPAVPMLFMGEEWASTRPFLFFTDHAGDQLRMAVRQGRRAEFAEFLHADGLEEIPDPNDPATFARSHLDPSDAGTPAAIARSALIRHLLQLRRAYLLPWLAQARSLGARSLGSHAFAAHWELGAGGRLGLFSNLGRTPVPVSFAGTSQRRWLHGDAIVIAAFCAGQLPAATSLICLEPTP
ncbi:MAG: malto-oligosyltrehalose trehalohydrolase [Rhodanobacter sp.]